MFIRTKSIYGTEYAYLVENTWTEKTARQTVKKYLGKVIRINQNPNNTPSIPGTLNARFIESIRTLIQDNVKKQGFQERQDNLVLNDTICNITNGSCTHKGKPCVIAMNNGHLCEETLRQVLLFTPNGREEDIGKELAPLLVQAGIHVTAEQFVALVEQAAHEHPADPTTQ